MAASPGGAGPTDGSGRELTEGSGGRPGDGLTDDSGPRPGPIDHGSTQGPQDAPQGGPGQAGHPGHSGSGRHRRPTSLGPLRRGIREVGLALITAGVIILLFVGYQLWGTGIAEAHSQAALKRDFNATVTATHGGSGGTDTPTVGGATPTAASTVTASGAVDHLVIPQIHLDVFVVEGVSEDDLRRGPGHYPQTVFPGQNGNAAIAGHRTTYGAPFFSLDGLSVGDQISVTNTTGQTFIYKVSVPPRVVSPNDVAVLDPTPYAELTLTTCNPRYSASSRLIIVARLARGATLPANPAVPVSATPSGAATPPSRAAPVVAADTLGRGDRGAWPPTLAFGALVVALWIGVRVLVNRTRRWVRAGVLVGGIAVCLVPLWFTFENTVRLLPQNI